ncbi:hypothetical protein ABZ351_36885, partial [Streptomyces microflavus]|uniref:hypothetical protein n=1 Tax=Streptomyces microflavus TaxID=1919 RepID=UPI0033D1D406
MPGRIRLTGYRPDEPVGDAFTVTGFGGAGFPEQATLRELISPAQPHLAGTIMVRGDQQRQHSYWLRYLRRRSGPAGPKRVCVDLLVRFSTFDYVVADVGVGALVLRQSALSHFPCWGITDLSVSLMPTGRGRNPFNKFNESGSLTFDAAVANDGMPHLRINYRVQHQAKNLLGAPLGLSHNDAGAFLVHSNGSFEINHGEGRTDKHFRITPLSGSVHQ